MKLETTVEEISKWTVTQISVSVATITKSVHLSSDKFKPVNGQAKQSFVSPIILFLYTI